MEAGRKRAAEHIRSWHFRFHYIRAMEKAYLIEMIYRAIEEFNTMQEEDEQLEMTPETSLADLDEVALVNFLVTLDEMMDEDQVTVAISFDIEHALENRDSLLVNVDSLADHLVQLTSPEK